MTTLIVDRSGAQLSITSSSVLRLAYENEETHRIGLKALKQVVLLGDVRLSTKVLRACHEANVDVILLPKRGRAPVLYILPSSQTGTELRHAQHVAYSNPEQRLSLARQIVQKKISQQEAWLNVHGLTPDFERFYSAAADVSCHNTLLGIEGAASARYFQHWGRIWKSPWKFTTRNRRPPLDPINALLSLAYGLALSYAGRLAGLKGFDLAIGFLHGPLRERPSLPLDLIETLRPRIDHWVWQILNDATTLRPEHFSISDAEGCRLTKEGRAIVFSYWYRIENDWLRATTRDSLALVIKSLRHDLPASKKNEGSEPDGNSKE